VTVVSHYIIFNIMSDSAQLIKIIGDIMQGTDTVLRKQSEDLLTSLRS
jgi:UDP-N-acetylglucosamine 2-epimerase